MLNEQNEPYIWNGNHWVYMEAIGYNTKYVIDPGEVLKVMESLTFDRGNIGR